MEKDKIQLVSGIEPPLQNEKYPVKVSQSTNIPDSQIASEEYRADMFSLNLNEINLVYPPPPNSSGNFESILPHIVFTRHTYPWERFMKGSKENSKEFTCLALLLFTESEDVKCSTMTCRNAFAETPNVYCPVKPSGHEDDICTIIDVQKDLFYATCPTLEDLKFTANTRCVRRNLQAEEKQPVDKWFSVLIGTRTPCFATDNQGIKNTIYLVSLEFFHDFLIGQNLREKIASTQAIHYVRIPVLYSWNFHCEKDSFGFQNMCDSSTSLQLLHSQVNLINSNSKHFFG